jgi:transposase-like protein
VGHAPPHAISISVATGLIGKVEFPDFTPTKELIPMTEDRLPLAELLAKSGDGDFLRTIAESVLQIIMEADVEGLVGAARHERSGDRTTWRNGYRDRSLDTRLGTLNLKIPKLRTGACFPGFLEPRKTVEKALVAVIQEAWIAGVSTRRVDDLVQAMGMTGISKSSVSKLCKDIDERVHAFLKRPLTGEWPYLWLDATYLKVRQGGRIVSVAAIIAVAVNTEGKREIVGLHIGPSEGRGVLVGLPQGPRPPRADGGQAGHLGCP